MKPLKVAAGVLFANESCIFEELRRTAFYEISLQLYGVFEIDSIRV
jgi:hypothetical protein